MSDEDIISRIMDKAATADRQALFAALQAAIAVIVDSVYAPERPTKDRAFTPVERALDLGAPYGSPEHLRSLEANRGLLEGDKP